MKKILKTITIALVLCICASVYVSCEAIKKSDVVGTWHQIDSSWYMDFKTDGSALYYCDIDDDGDFDEYDRMPSTAISADGSEKTIVWYHEITWRIEGNKIITLQDTEVGLEECEYELSADGLTMALWGNFDSETVYEKISQSLVKE